MNLLRTSTDSPRLNIEDYDRDAILAHVRERGLLVWEWQGAAGVIPTGILLNAMYHAEMRRIAKKRMPHGDFPGEGHIITWDQVIPARRPALEAPLLPFRRQWLPPSPSTEDD